jgi:hypothetical protein
VYYDNPDAINAASYRVVNATRFNSREKSSTNLVIETLTLYVRMKYGPESLVVLLQTVRNVTGSSLW